MVCAWRICVSLIINASQGKGCFAPASCLVGNGNEKRRPQLSSNAADGVIALSPPPPPLPAAPPSATAGRSSAGAQRATFVAAPFADDVEGRQDAVVVMSHSSSQQPGSSQSVLHG